MKLVRARAKKGRPGLCVEDVSFPENQEGANLPLVLLLPGFAITKTLVRWGEKKRDGWIKARQVHSRDQSTGPPRPAGLTVAVREVGVWRRARQRRQRKLQRTNIPHVAAL